MSGNPRPGLESQIAIGDEQRRGRHRVQSRDVTDRYHHVSMLADYGQSQEDPEYEG